MRTEEGLLERLERHPLTREIERQDRETNRARRKELIGEIAQLDRDRIASLPATKSAIAQSQAAVDRAREALALTERSHSELLDKEIIARGTYDHQRGRALGELLSLPSPLISTFITEMTADYDTTRHKVRSAEQAGPMNPYTLKRTPVYSSNAASVNRCLEAIRGARKRAEAMKFENLTDEEIAAELKGLRDGLPAIEDLTVETRLAQR